MRDALRVLMTEFLAFLDDSTEPAASSVSSALAQSATSPAAPPTPLVAQAPVLPAPDPVSRETQMLKMGGATWPIQAISVPAESKADGKPAGFAGPVVVEPAPHAEVAAVAADLELIAQRSRIKAEACRWSVERRRRIEAGDDFREFADGYRELITQAKSLPNCYLWMIDPRGPSLPTDDMMQTLAGCYDTLAQAAELVGWLREVPEAEQSLTESFYLLAEAQSALRAGLLEVLHTGEDQDQRDTFWWLRNEAFERRIFIDRYMRVDDTAAPEGWLALQNRLSASREAIEQRKKQGRERSSLLNKVRYHATRVARAEGGPAEDDWRKMAVAIETMVTQGMPASNVDVRELLLPLEAGIPDLPFGPGMTSVLEELDRYQSTSTRAETIPAERQWGPEVAQVAQLLRGKKILLVGGHRRPQAQRALEEAFELEEVIWPTTEKHESLSRFEPDVAKPAVALVVMAIRWSSHSYGELKDLCDKYHKLFVRLKAGYNANQVARAILDQAGIELGRRAVG